MKFSLSYATVCDVMVVANGVGKANECFFLILKNLKNSIE